MTLAVTWMGLEVIILSKARKRQGYHITYRSCQNMTQMNSSMKQKQTHKPREQACHCQGPPAFPVLWKPLCCSVSFPGRICFSVSADLWFIDCGSCWGWCFTPGSVLYKEQIQMQGSALKPLWSSISPGAFSGNRTWSTAAPREGRRPCGCLSPGKGWFQELFERGEEKGWPPIISDWLLSFKGQV